MGWYSKTVAILKIGLPLVALALLAGLFFVQTDDNFGGEVMFSSADLESLGQGLQVANPILTGTTEDEDRFQFIADRVVPDAVPPQFATLTNISGVIEFSDTSQIRVSGQNGYMDLKTKLLKLDGSIKIEDSSGYTVLSEYLEINLADGSVKTDKPVHGEGPQGKIDAGSMKIEPSALDDEKRLFFFGNGVQLLYKPV